MAHRQPEAPKNTHAHTRITQMYDCSVGKNRQPIGQELSKEKKESKAEATTAEKELKV